MPGKKLSGSGHRPSYPATAKRTSDELKFSAAAGGGNQLFQVLPAT